LTRYANLSELKYREEIQLREPQYESIQKWCKRAQDYIHIISFLEKEGIRFYGMVLVLGAGSCWLPFTLSKLRTTQRIYALDFSKTLLTIVAPEIMRHLKADMSKIVRVRGDFYDLSYFKENSFDFVIYDAALHHADYPMITLREASRVLKSNGKLLCISEPVAPSLSPFKEFWKRKLGRRERKLGITENIFTLDEWRSIFNRCDLTFRAIRLKLKVRSKLARLPIINRLVPGSYCFVSKKLCRGL
jgi:ubiquinone/menaquinone biosynthesis C-methylase UbiE